MEGKKWEILAQGPAKSVRDIVAILLQNREITTKGDIEEFFHPRQPKEIVISQTGIDERELSKAITRLKRAHADHEKVIVFGDYDADGVCATAIMWEALFERGIDALPYIPDRFSEGYGLRAAAIAELKKKHPNLGVIITVDNGIVAYEGAKAASALGIDLIVTDHHQKGGKKLDSFATIHTTLTSGSAVSWLFVRELGQQLLKTRQAPEVDLSLDEGIALAAIGTISDQLPLVGINRSIVKFGLQSLHQTRKPGLHAIAEQANIRCEDMGVYEIGFIVAPRINAAGRLAHAIDSLRLVCTKDGAKARALSQTISQANTKRQQMVEEMVFQADVMANKIKSDGFLVIASPDFHEGIIGLAASKMVDKYSKPAIVISMGPEISKASARSLPGINIIKVLRELDEFLVEVGGHEMAAGFSIETSKIDDFLIQLEEKTHKLITKELMAKRIRVDLELPLSVLDWDLAEKLIEFEPLGLGNPTPVFATRGLQVADAKAVGSDGKHLKLKVTDGTNTIDAIAFGFGPHLAEIKKNPIDVAYSLEKNTYNGSTTLQLKVKDIQLL